MEEKENSILEQEEKKSWSETPYERAPWVPIAHGQTILPQNEQKSNNDLTDDQVLQSRMEPIGKSFAKPLTRKDTGHSNSDDPNGKKANLPSNFTRI